MTTAEIPTGQQFDEPEQHGGLSPLGYKIFLDRYALKDMTKKSIAPGDTVVVVVDQKTGQREIGTVTARNDSTVVVELRDGGSVQQAIEHVDKPLETHPSQMAARVARGIAEIEAPEKRDEWRRNFEWLLSDWRFLPGGRILAAAGTDQQLTFYNCFVIPSPKDSRRGIIETLSNMMEIMSRGGGVGINVSSLRPKHAYVKGVNGRSSGAVSWGGLYSFVTGLIEQGGSRRGALMLILNDWHPDLPEFIAAKREAGKITNANISVGISDAFMQAVEADADWQLVFPDTAHPDYAAEWNGDLEAWTAAGRPVVIHRTLKAREIWTAIIESAWASAEPGVYFRERANQMSNSWYYPEGQLICTNPCVTGDTLVATADGWRRVDEIVVGDTIGTVLGQGQVARVEVYEDRPVFRVRLSDGAEMRVTAAHQFHAIPNRDRPKNSANKRFTEMRLDELAVGDYVRIAPALMPDNPVPGLPDGWTDREYGFLLGLLLGDGCYTPKTLARDRVKIAVDGAEPEWAATVEALLTKAGEGVIVHNLSGERSLNLTAQTKATATLVRESLLPAAYAHEKRIPLAYQQTNGPFLAGLLDGLFSADGNVNLRSSHPCLRLKTTSKDLALDVRRILLMFGIHGRVVRGTAVDGRIGARRIIARHQPYEVLVSGASLKTFADRVGISHPGKADRLRQAQRQFALTGNTWIARIESIEPDGVETVYDLFEPNSDTWITEGAVSRGCGEQPLPAWGICNLGAIHLAKFVSPEGEVLWDDLGRAVRYGVRFLDDVIDATPYFFEENAAQQGSERRVGLGTMGLGEMLIRLGIRYGSPESEAFIDRLYQFIATEAYLASADHAAEKGAFPRFDAEKLLQSGYMRTMPEPVRAAVREKGLRNVTLLTQAPTGTTGTMMDTSTGIEPYFSWSYFRKGRLGLHEVTVPVLAEWKQAHPGEELPDYFVAAMDLTPEEHVRVEAAIQRWIDSSISKTANLPADYTVEQTRELYELMYRLGCKGGTVYRDSSRDEQVLMLKTEAPAATAVTVSDVTGHAASALPAVVDPRPSSLPAEPEARPAPRRVPLPDERSSITHKFTVGEQEGYITVGVYDDGAPGEVFLRVSKQGSTVSGLMESLGLLTSVALQYGVPLEGLARKMKNSRFEPYGMTGNREIPTATSLVDYVFRWLEKKFVLGEQLPLLPVVGSASPPATVSGHAQLSMALEATVSEPAVLEKPGVEYLPSGMGCPECGSLLHHAEGCLICRSCGYTKCG